MPQLRLALRRKHYSYQTEKAYCMWVKSFIKFHQMKHPAKMSKSEIRALLDYLASERHVAASTQNQALNAIVFLYREVLQVELGEIGKFLRAKKAAVLPVVLSKDEVSRVLRAGLTVQLSC